VHLPIPYRHQAPLNQCAPDRREQKQRQCKAELRTLTFSEERLFKAFSVTLSPAEIYPLWLSVKKSHKSNR